MNYYKKAMSVCLIALLTACSGSGYNAATYVPGDTVSNNEVGLATTQEVVPKNEPKSASGNSPYTVFGTHYQPLGSANGYREVGLASWYGAEFHGRGTVSGETYNMYAMSAAHRTLPLPSYVKVTHLKNKRSVIVRVNDRGPFIDTDSRIIDLSYAAAAKLGVIATGVARVEVQAINSTVSESNIVERQPVTAPKVRSVLAEGTYLQIGTYSQSANAQAMLWRLLQNGFTGFIHTAPDAAGVYTVKLGPYRDADAALQKKQIVDERLAMEARVVFE